MNNWVLKYFHESDRKNEKIFKLNYGLNNIGRAWSNTLVLDNDTVSRNHCQLWIRNNSIAIIKDVGSMNGTFVQGIQLECVEEYILKENDMIYLSNYPKGVLLQLCKDKNVK